MHSKIPTAFFYLLCFTLIGISISDNSTGGSLTKIVCQTNRQCFHRLSMFSYCSKLHVCTCRPGFKLVDRSGLRCVKSGHRMCSINLWCTFWFSHNSICNKGVCICKPNFKLMTIDKQARCTKNVRLNEKCDKYLLCKIKDAECRNGYCRCQINRKWDGNNQCVPEVLVNKTFAISCSLLALFVVIFITFVVLIILRKRRQHHPNNHSSEPFTIFRPTET